MSFLSFHTWSDEAELHLFQSYVFSIDKHYLHIFISTSLFLLSIHILSVSSYFITQLCLKCYFRTDSLLIKWLFALNYLIFHFLISFHYQFSGLFSLFYSFKHSRKFFFPEIFLIYLITQLINKEILILTSSPC